MWARSEIKMPPSASKQFFENTIIGYTLLWMSSLAIIVHWKLYEYFNSHHYLILSLIYAIPCLLLPFIVADKAEKTLPFSKRFNTKANIFIGIVSYIGNYFFTHYFYSVLGMQYTGPLAIGKGIDHNGVPLSMYFMTHVYFTSNHVIITKILRTFSNRLVIIIPVIILAIVTAFMETFTISNFPYYTYPDYHMMITTGSLFYSIFLSVTFLIFYHIDETRYSWSLTEVSFSSLGGMMIVLLLADYCRLVSGTKNIISNT